MNDVERIERIISTVEKEIGFRLREEQRQIVVNDGYPLFLLSGMPRRWGKTTVAMIWTLAHGPAVISYAAEKGVLTAMRNAYTEKRHMALPALPDPDFLFHPIMMLDAFRDLQRLASAVISAGIPAPRIEIRNQDIDFLRREFHIPQ